jgi:cysteine desulfurase/selenocysteine lyase
MYSLAEKATARFEQARATIAGFINAQPQEIIITKGATEGINFIAATWAEHTLQEGDEIVLTELEHHANLIPWQQLAQRKNSVLKFIPINPDGSLNYDTLNDIITARTRFVTITHVSNAIGTTVDIKRIITMAQAVGARVLIDACQSIPHQPIDVKDIDCDFLVFSGHKMLGPTGIGILYMHQRMHSQVPPYHFGGGMIFEASYERATWLPSPARYEAGTPPVAQAIGLAEAINFLMNEIDFDRLISYESHLCGQFIKGLEAIPGFRIIGPTEDLIKRGHLVSFVHDSYHPHDIAAYLDTFGICVRSGHYCAQPLARKLGIEGGSVRASFYMYNTPSQIEQCLSVLKKLH